MNVDSGGRSFVVWSDSLLCIFSVGNCLVAIVVDPWMTPPSGSRLLYSGGGRWTLTSLGRGGSSMSDGLPKLREVREPASLSSSELESSCSGSC